MAKAVWAASIACVLFVLVALHEWSYKSNHPHAYGPAVVITVAALAGALTAGVMAFVAFDIQRQREADWQKNR